MLHVDLYTVQQNTIDPSHKSFDCSLLLNSSFQCTKLCVTAFRCVDAFIPLHVISRVCKRVHPVLEFNQLYYFHTEEKEVAKIHKVFPQAVKQDYCYSVKLNELFFTSILKYTGYLIILASLEFIVIW